MCFAFVDYVLTKKKKKYIYVGPMLLQCADNSPIGWEGGYKVGINYSDNSNMKFFYPNFTSEILRRETFNIVCHHS